MNRRRFLALTAAGVAVPRCLAAQGAAKVAHVGFISGVDQAAAVDFLAALRDGLSGFGYVEPNTLKLDLFFAENVPERIPGLVEELERRHVDVIVTHAAATGAVVKARRTIPVVYEFSADPVTLDIAKDLAHPLLNATGITLLRSELNGKRLELLREILPKLRRVAVVANPLHPGQQLERAESEAKARQLGIDITLYSTPNREDLDRALSAIAANPPQAVLLFSDAFIVEHRKSILDFALSHHLPVVSGWAVMAKNGALCTYGPRIKESYRRSAYFVDRILKGAKPAELPIEQPTVLELVVNLRTAKALGVNVPAAILARADEVIE